MKTSSKIILAVVIFASLWVAIRATIITKGVQNLVNEKETAYIEKIGQSKQFDNVTAIEVVADGYVELSLSSHRLQMRIAGNHKQLEIDNTVKDETLTITIKGAGTKGRINYWTLDIPKINQIGFRQITDNCQANRQLNLDVEQYAGEHLVIDGTHLGNIHIADCTFEHLHIISEAGPCPLRFKILENTAVSDLHIELPRKGTTVLETKGSATNHLNVSDSMKIIAPITRINTQGI